MVKAHPAVASWSVLGVIGLVYSIATYVLDAGGIILWIVGEDLPKIEASYSPDGGTLGFIQDGQILNSFAENESCSLSFTLRENNEGVHQIRPDIPHKFVYVFQINNVITENNECRNDLGVYRLFPEKENDSSEVVNGVTHKVKCKRDGPSGKGKVYFLVSREREEIFLHEQNGPIQPAPKELCEPYFGPFCQSFKKIGTLKGTLKVIKYCLLQPYLPNYSKVPMHPLKTIFAQMSSINQPPRQFIASHSRSKKPA